MSMRNYGVETKGVAIEISDFEKLMLSNAKNIKHKFRVDNLDIQNIDLYDLLESLNMYDIIEFIDEIEFAIFMGEFNGYLETDKKQERIYFDNDDIIILELKKISLYEKYENREEIISELKEALDKVGIKVDNEYIEEHFGYINGSYFA